MQAAWRLITTGRRYLPPPAPDDPIAGELRKLAERDRAAGVVPGDWSGEERERWLKGLRGQRTLMAFYEPVRWPDRVLAPPAWRDEAVLIAAATLGPWAWRKLRHEYVPASPSWTFFLAARIIYAIGERRSWRSAYRG